MKLAEQPMTQRQKRGWNRSGQEPVATTQLYCRISNIKIRHSSDLPSNRKEGLNLVWRWKDFMIWSDGVTHNRFLVARVISRKMNITRYHRRPYQAIRIWCKIRIINLSENRPLAKRADHQINKI